MATITLRQVTKKFGLVRAVDDVSLDIADGEVVCLLGPSGCGKTTTLRMIAGFERPTSGEIAIGNRIVSSARHAIPPEHRNLGMVFQNYAVWPHMTVYENVRYPLKLRRLNRSLVKAKVMETIALVGLAGLEKRYPEQLSGGQQQRVALARALVAEPKALLLDEPLSNLDAKLRERMRFEIMDLHRRMRMTIVYVTHDQAEAMVLADRVVVMDQGRVAQIGTPWQIYREPRSPFVADFIGLANLIPAKLVEMTANYGLAILGEPQGPCIRCIVPDPRPHHLPHEGVLFVRPEEVALLPPQEGDIMGHVARAVFLGAKLDVRIKAHGSEWRAEVPANIDVKEGATVGLRLGTPLFFAQQQGDKDGA